jgi:hypothetical protein
MDGLLPCEKLSAVVFYFWIGVLKIEGNVSDQFIGSLSFRNVGLG